ncbi:hypothetical protein ACE38W_03235 [Chitinophaga sp. Hz27]|uniref:hypothetical protein n=1 Tax=Chitinophaga sp. Hz27 TaxID=3347169 RepID=UPI0035DB8377
MNILAYIIYFFITALITILAGWLFYHNGRHFILYFFKGDVGLTDSVNKLLLIGYYLLNLGYAIIMIGFWEQLNSWQQLIETVASMCGRIMITLGIIHWVNMATIYLLGKKRENNT